MRHLTVIKKLLLSNSLRLEGGYASVFDDRRNNSTRKCQSPRTTAPTTRSVDRDRFLVVLPKGDLLISAKHLLVAANDFMKTRPSCRVRQNRHRPGAATSDRQVRLVPPH